jgi:hypothetical protein
MNAPMHAHGCDHVCTWQQPTLPYPDVTRSPGMSLKIHVYGPHICNVLKGSCTHAASSQTAKLNSADAAAEQPVAQQRPSRDPTWHNLSPPATAMWDVGLVQPTVLVRPRERCKKRQEGETLLEQRPTMPGQACIASKPVSPGQEPRSTPLKIVHCRVPDLTCDFHLPAAYAGLQRHCIQPYRPPVHADAPGGTPAWNAPSNGY